MREIKIDFDNPGFPQRLDVVENDAQSRFFKAVLYKDGKAYAAPSGATYSIMYRGFGPQNEGWYDTINDGSGKRAACSVSGNVVTCEIARQALRVPGHVSVVLCVTGSNGYMLHGWPIDCNCRNDNYTGGTSVESFFYITQVTNADWTSAIQTWEELKNMIDPTLSVKGKAADAAKVGEAVGQVKEDLSNLFSEPYIPVSDRTTVDIVNGNDVFSNVSLKSGNEYVVLSNYTGVVYVYNDDDPQDRHYLINGYCEFTPNANRTMVSGSGTFTAQLIFVDVTDQPSYKDTLKKNGFDYAGKYHVGYKDLDELLSENFIPLVNILNRISTNTAIKSDSIDKSNIDGNNFIIKINDNNKDGYIIFQETLKAGHKYAIFYKTKANSNYGFSLRLYDSGWVQNVIYVKQTANVVATGTTIVSVNANGNFSIDLTSENNGTEFTGTLKVYDITGLDNIVETFDFENLKDETVELKVNRSQEIASDKHLNGKKVVFYGDSITAQNKFPVIVKEYYGINAVNMGVGGSTIFYRSDTDMSSDSRISSIPSDADIVMIMGGTNDWGKTQIEEELTYSNGFDRTKFKGAVAYIIQKIQQQCPNAKIIWCTTIGGQNETRATSSPTVQYLPQKDQFGQSGYTFRNAEIEVCNTLGIEVCDTWSCGINGNNAYTMIEDTVHPTDAGAKLIANHIIGYLKTVII